MTAVATVSLSLSHCEQHHHRHAFEHVMADSDVNVQQQQQPKKATGSKRSMAERDDNKNDSGDKDGSARNSKKQKKEQSQQPKEQQQQPTQGQARKMLVQIKGTRLVLRQKAVDWTRSMSTLQAILALNQYLSSVDGLVEEIPTEHLHAIAKLTQESDKSLSELARSIKKTVIPEADATASSSSSDDASCSTATVTNTKTVKTASIVTAIEKAIETVAERINYGLTSLDDTDLPPGMSIWRWEVKDAAMLPSESADKMLARRAERKSEQIYEDARELLRGLGKDAAASLLKRGWSNAVKDGGVSRDSEEKENKAADKADVIDIDDMQTPPPPETKETKVAATPVPASPAASASPMSTKQKSTKKAVDPEEEARKEAKRQEKEAKRIERQEREAVKQAQREAAEAKKQKEEQAKKKQASMMFSLFQQQPRANSASPSKQQGQQQQQQHQLTPQRKAQEQQSISDFERAFPACNYRDLAPINRFHRTVGGVDSRDDEEKDWTTPALLENLKARSSTSSCSGKDKVQATKSARRGRRGIHPPVSVREVMRQITEASVLIGDDQLEEHGRRALASLADRQKVPIKLLSFHTDRRPAWYGTWTRATNLVNMRRPLGQDPVALDYSYESDAEWEDADAMEGDDVQDNEDEDGGDDAASRSDADSEMDDWLVDDLEEEDEDETMGEPPKGVFDDEDDDIQFVAAKSKNTPKSLLMPAGLSTKPSAMGSMKHKKRKIKPIGRRFEAKLVPFQTGPHWHVPGTQPSFESFKAYQMEFINDAGPGLNPFTFESAPPPPVQMPSTEILANAESTELVSASSSNSNAAAGTSATPNQQSKASAFPQEHLSSLLQAIEGDTRIRAVLVEMLREKFSSVKGATKGIIDACVAVYAERQGKKQGSPWLIKPHYRKMAGL